MSKIGPMEFSPGRRKKARARGALLLAGSLIVLSLVGCLTAGAPGYPPERTEALYTPSFAWKPPPHAATAATNIAVAVGVARWARQPSEPAGQLPADWFRGYAKQFGGDFARLLESLGYSVQGPFASLDAMTAEDKKKSDMVFFPTVSLALHREGTTLSQVGSLYSSTVAYMTYAMVYPQIPVYHATIAATLTGTVTLVLREPLTGRTLWTRDVPLPDMSLDLEGLKNYVRSGHDLNYFQSVDGHIRRLPIQSGLDGPDVPSALFLDAGIEAGGAKAVESSYDRALDLLAQYVDVNEMRRLDATARQWRTSVEAGGG